MARGSRRTRTVRPRPPPRPAGTTPLAIVGLGASAGGLVALELFLRNVPLASGLAFAVVQHLDPSRPALLPELLQRATPMPVVEARQGLRVEPDHVYVIPSNRDLSISKGRLRLLQPDAPRGQHLPIDRFFRALAEDRGEAAVGVVLSGMGSDGTEGLQAIRKLGGLAAAQDPATAAFDSMPRSVVEAGIADVVGPAEALPPRLLALLRARYEGRLPRRGPTRQSAATLDEITAVLRARSSHDFSQYKKSTLQRRVARRMALHQLTSLAGYLRFLLDNPQEQDLLFDELLIGVTSFFRDAAVWDALRDRVFPELFARHPGGARLRAWSVGCSTGEEAYSLGITFREAIERTAPRGSFSLQIFATDLNEASITRARQGTYPASIEGDLSPERLRRHFVREEDGRYRVGKEIREQVILAPQDLIRDPPFTRLDLLVCRNLLIYLEPELQRRVLPLFHHALNAGGVLVLGNSETIGSRTDLFSAADTKLRIYRRKPSGARLDPGDFPSSYAPPREAAVPAPEARRPAESLAQLADQALLQHAGPPAVLVNEAGDVVYFSGRTGPFLEPATGKAAWNLFAMAREGLRQELAMAVRSALRRRKPVHTAGVKLVGGGAPRRVDLAIFPLEEPEALRGMLLVTFAEGARAAAPAGRAPARSRGQHAQLAEMEHELRRALEELQATREEMRASHEELRSANEELQSTNEELQSTNEELTTSKEELQSMNEELQTVNGELQAKLDELSRTNNDMKNLLNASEIATIFLDRDLKVRRFTAQATRLVRLIPGDLGRPITDLSAELLYPGLAADVEEVLHTLVFRERQLATGDGRWFTVRVLPYRTLENLIDGVVITMLEITAAKQLEAQLRQDRDRFAAFLAQLPASVVILDEAEAIVPAAEVPRRIAAAVGGILGAWRIVAAQTAKD